MRAPDLKRWTMLLGILSDTHDQLQRTQGAVQLLCDAGAEALVHCGDFTKPNIVEVCAVLPFYFVFGNNDHVGDLRTAGQCAGAVCLEWGGQATLGGKRVAVTHGHRHTNVRQLLATQPDYLLSGHSHVTEDRRVDAVRLINPGALHRSRQFTVALLDLATDHLRFLPAPR